MGRKFEKSIFSHEEIGAIEAMYRSDRSDTERAEEGSDFGMLHGDRRSPALPCSSTLKAGCILGAFLVPLKLSLAYVVLVPTILGWLISTSWRSGLLTGSARERAITVPLAFFLLTTTLSAILGIDVINSVSPLSSLFFFALTIFAFRDFGNCAAVPVALITGQAIAALHSVLAATFPNTIPSVFLGSVTESGQLALSIFLCLGIAAQKYHEGRSTMSPATPRVAAACGTIAIALLGCSGFRGAAQIDSTTLALSWLLGLSLITLLIKAVKPATAHARGLLTLSILYLPLLTCALLVNLKRGPWFGVAIGLAVFCVFFSRRLLPIIVTSAVFIALAVPPVRERLAASWEHFTISGGRSTIWRIGAELISQYPLGIGYHNSGVLRQFSPEVPPELKHFHNNLINIWAESGILSASIFVWFICATVRACFSKPISIPHIAIGCAVISWQVAGLVEYNFGDSEVVIIAWILLGLLLRDFRAQNDTPQSNSRR